MAESNFYNNEIICNLQLTTVNARATNCHIPDDYALDYLDQFYEETVFEDWKTGSLDIPDTSVDPTPTRN